MHNVFPEMQEEDERGISSIKYPRPISEPPSPSSSRVTTPAASLHGSDDESESVDSEGEVCRMFFNLFLNLKNIFSKSFINFTFCF